jgi:hypothetical protein
MSVESADPSTHALLCGDWVGPLRFDGVAIPAELVAELDAGVCGLCGHIYFVLFFADLPGLAVPRRF